MKTLQSLMIKMSPVMEVALKQMLEAANYMDVKVGTAAISVSHADVKDYALTLTLINNRSVRVGVSDKVDVNYTGVVLAKIAQMQRTGKPSGADDGFIGEVPYRGGVVVKGEYTILIAYSGGTEEEDVAISSTGAKVMNT